MNRSNQGVFPAFRRSVFELCIIVGATAAIVNGCGGTVVDDSHHGQGDGTGGGTSVDYGSGGQTGKAACGNGRIDPGERCDYYALGGQNCSTASLGMYTGGQLKCLADCSDWDTSGCFTSDGAGGYYNTGGYQATGGYGVGGFGAFGGFGGYSGGPMIDGGVAYCPPGTVPDPLRPLTCSASDGGVDGCREWVSRQIPEMQSVGYCGVECNCTRCPTQLSNCLTDPACAAIERCVIANACVDSTCPACAGIGQNTGTGAPDKARQFEKCSMAQGCGVVCPSYDGGLFR